MDVSSWLSKYIIQPWLPTNPALSNYQKISNRFFVNVLISTFVYTCVLILSTHLFLPLEPQGKAIILHFSSILGSGILIALLTIRFGGYRIAALNIFIATLCIGLILVSLQTGGVNSPVNPSAIAIPALATLSIGAMAGVIWGLVVFAAATFSFIAAHSGYTFVNIIAPHNLAIAEFSGLFTGGTLTLFIVIYFDISSRKLRDLLNAEHAKYIQLAHHDSLTGLANRRYFIDKVEAAIARTSADKNTFCVLYFDLNNFKKINDTLGHHSGDQVLREFAKRLRKLTRTSDIIARLGGDEFCIVLLGLDDADIIKLKINDYAQALSEPLMLETTQYQISASIGYAIYPNHGTSYEALLRIADQKMYQVKRNRVDSILVSPAD